MKDNIFSGEHSRRLWDEINSLDELSTGDDIHNVLYTLGCYMQELESKFDKLIKVDPEAEDDE